MICCEIKLLITLGISFILTRSNNAHNFIKVFYPNDNNAM